MYIVKVYKNVPYKEHAGTFFTANSDLLETLLKSVEWNYDSWSVEENNVRFAMKGDF